MLAKPTAPKPRGGPASRVSGAFKERPEDFVVEEVPAYQPSGEGEHVYLWIQKTGLSTFDAVAALARALEKRDRDFGFAGMKDAQAVTRQWISIAGVDEAVVRGLDLDGIDVLDVRRHGNKLKLGHLRGNRFEILLRGVPSEDLASVEANLADLERRGVPNYFGEQRFGKRGANLEKGLKILRGNPRKAARTMPRRLLNLVISAVQSEVFNRVLVRRRDVAHRVEVGDVAWIHRNGACFVVEDAEAEAERARTFEISPSGPMPGPKMLIPQGAVGDLEAEVLAELELDYEIFGRMPYGTHDGARRPLRVPVTEPTAAVDADGVRVSFALPKGSYATTVLRELLRDAPWFG